MKSKQCLKYVVDTQTKKHRRCRRRAKNLYCPTHFKNDFCMYHKTGASCVGIDVEHGLCCFCGEPCNASSQSCGACPREFMAQNFWK